MTLLLIVLWSLVMCGDSFSLRQSLLVRSSSSSTFNRYMATPSEGDTNAPEASTPQAPNQKGRIVVIDIPLGDGFQAVKVQFKPIFAKSKFFTVTYDVPFSLNVGPPPKGFPAPLVKKGGSGGEEIGDALRACTSWSQGFAAAGATSDIFAFAGNVKVRKSVFDCTMAPWDAVVTALTSNTAERTDAVTLIFERELE